MRDGTDVRWASHFTRELSFPKVIETHETTQMKDYLIVAITPNLNVLGHLEHIFLAM